MVFEKIKGMLAINQSGTADWNARPDASRIAVCVILLEIAEADNILTPAGREQIMKFFEEHARLSEQSTEDLLKLAEEVRHQSIELFQFTRLISENFPLEEKLRLVETMWRIIYLDGQLDAEEDYLIHKLSTLLGLRHSELIEVKLRVLQSANRPESPGNSSDS